MRLTSLGKCTVLMLTCGFAIGTYRLWLHTSSDSAYASGDGWQRRDNTTNIELMTTATKQGWMQDQITRFNAAHQGQWRIVPRIKETRQAMHTILANQEHPVLWSPVSSIWAARLSEAWNLHHSGSIIDMSDPASYRVYLRTPIVLLTTAQKAAYLRPVLGSSKTWQNVLHWSQNSRDLPWGTFKWAHADPLNANSAILTLGLILNDYGQRTAQASALDSIVSSPGFIKYLQSMETNAVYDKACAGGSGALTKAFLHDPARYDFITTYESSALEAAATHPDLAVIYPTPTAVAEQLVVALQGSWVSPQQQQGAAAFMKFLGTATSLDDGIKYHFRPAQETGTLSLANELSLYGEQGFQQTFTTAELPPYAALNSAAYQWSVHVAHHAPA